MLLDPESFRVLYPCIVWALRPTTLEPLNPEALHTIHTLLSTTSMGQCPHSSVEMRGQVEGEGYLSSVERSPCCVCAQQRILDSPVRACPTLGNSYVRVLVESGLQCAVMYEGCDGLLKM